MRKNKHALFITLITVLLVFFSPLSSAEQQSYGDKTSDKFARSMSNIGLSVLEIPKNIINRTNESNVFYGLVGGGFQGVLNMGGRMGVGLLDLLTLPLPTKPITDPLHPWQQYFEKDTQYENIFVLDFENQ